MDDAIKPNGRRDGFEHNKQHYALLDYIQPVATTLSKIIEDTSRDRNKLKANNNIHEFVSKNKSVKGDNAPQTK